MLRALFDCLTVYLYRFAPHYEEIYQKSEDHQSDCTANNEDREIYDAHCLFITRHDYIVIGIEVINTCVFIVLKVSLCLIGDFSYCTRCVNHVEL